MCQLRSLGKLGAPVIETFHELRVLATNEDGDSTGLEGASTVVDSLFPPFPFFLSTLSFTLDVVPETHFSLSISDGLLMDLCSYDLSVNAPTFREYI